MATTNMVKHFRKKPVVIAAIQFTSDNMDEIEEFLGHTVYTKNIEKDPISKTKKTFFIINTLEGDMKVCEEDWVIRGVNGEFYPCKPDIFKKTYEEVK